MFDLKMDNKAWEARIKELMRKSPAALEAAMEKAGLEFLNWSNNGSTREPRKPPIRRGFLRGSSSAFLGSKLIGVYSGGDNKDVNRAYSEKDFVLTWGWNSVYATRMHEGVYEPGPMSQQDGDAGRKWAELHIDADRDALLTMIGTEFAKGLGTK